VAAGADSIDGKRMINHVRDGICLTRFEKHGTVTDIVQTLQKCAQF
jgi:hypothetical protein